MNYFSKIFVAASALVISSLSLAQAEVSFSTLDNVKTISEEKWRRIPKETLTNLTKSS